MGIDSRGGDIPLSSLNFKKPDFFDHSTHQERRQTLTTKVNSILNSRDETVPSSTFQELAALEPTEPQPRTLFNDKPSLYDQYHQQYLSEIQTNEGVQNRQKDISILAKRGIHNPDLIYDQLRSRGVSAQNTVSIGDSASAYFDEELIKTVDRLYSLELFEPDHFSQRYLIDHKHLVSSPSDETFLAIRNQLQPFTFLKGFDLTDQIFVYLSKEKLSPEKIDLLQSIQNSYFNNPEDESKFHQYIFQKYSKYKSGNYNFGKESSVLSFIFTDYKDSSEGESIDFVQTIISSGVQSGQKIDILPQIRQLASSKEEKIFDLFSGLSSRYEQNFLSKSISGGSVDYKQAKINDLFENGRPDKEFYFGMVEYSNESDPKIVIPDHILTNISRKYLSINEIKLIQALNEAPNTSHQKILSHLKKYYGDFSYYYTDGKPNFHFYQLALTNNELPKDFIQSENLDHLPLNQRNSILAASKFRSNNKIDDQGEGQDDDQCDTRDFILKNLNQADLFLDQNQQLTSFLFEQMIKSKEFKPDFFIKNLTPEIISAFSPEDQRIWQNAQNLLKQSPKSLPLVNFIFSHKDQSELFFDQDNQLTEFFFNSALYFNSKDVLSSLPFALKPKILAKFSPDNQKLWLNLLNFKYSKFADFAKFITSHPDQIDSFFTSDHQLTKAFFISILNKPNIADTVNTEINPFLKNTLPSIPDSDPDKPILVVISQINSSTGFRFLNQNRQIISQRINSAANPLETANQYAEIITQINLSPSKEIQKIKDRLLIEILNSPDPLASYQKISNIFINNNLPMVGKIYRIFESIYPPETIKKMLTDTNLSRVLINSHSPHLRQSIIFNDLLKANLSSGELSLINYLNLFKTNSVLLEKTKVGASINQSEKAQLSAFFKKLDTLYDSSLLSRSQSTETLNTPTLQSKIDQLYQKYQVKPGQSISDRVAEMYLSGLNLKTISEALSYASQSKQLANQRNLAQTEFSLSAGDLIKSVHSENLENILNFGCVAGEYLGADAGSDFTPFDTDFIRSASNYKANEVSSVGLSGYGDLFIIVKNRGQLQDTTNLPSPTYDSSKLEVFRSGVIGENHYGVRTGFPSSEIDFLVATDTESKKLATMYFQIATHGVYFPVLDSQGKLLFTPKDFEKYKINSEKINQTLSETEFDPTTLINSLKEVPYLQQVYEMKAGVSEGYSVEQHTQMVIGQFEKYFSADYDSDILSLEDFRFLLSLHDIGKGEAVSATGSTLEQHFYTQKIAKNILVQSGMSEKSSDIIIDLIDQDILGEYFKGGDSTDASSKKITELSKKIDVPTRDLMDILKMFYICDAGAYTSDAGGHSALDNLFQFNPNQGEVSFSNHIETKYQELITALNNSHGN